MTITGTLGFESSSILTNIQAQLDVHETTKANSENPAFTGTISVNISTTAPANSTSPGTKGQVVFDANFIYVCYADDNWHRVAINDDGWGAI